MQKISLLPAAFYRHLGFILLGILCSGSTDAQMITGVWKGRINRQKAEVKIIQKGDSLTGTAYYYESASRYRRYSIKGYFDPNTNETVWWDDQLIESKPGNNGGSDRQAMLSVADFNCPGDGRMMLDGKSGRKDQNNPTIDLHLDKVPDPIFPDEWDYVIDNFTIGANDPYIIDSIGRLSVRPEPTAPPIIARQSPSKEIPVITAPPVREEVAIRPPTIEEKFTSRKKVHVLDIPMAGDSIELRFYDNAEIDGDSISLFLNDKLIFSHIRLLGTAYTIKLATASLPQVSELIMVAENLGSIPPNTSFMVALMGEQRYEARLESTEGSSAMIRLLKQ